MLARALATPSNLLVLDEPTNDLDLETLDLLQEMLGDYPGTVLLVSHDRDFLDRVVTSVIVPEGDGRWLEYAGGYTDMVAQRGEALRAKPELRRDAARTAEAAKPVEAEMPAPPRKAQRRRLSFNDDHALATLPKVIADLERRVGALRLRLEDQTLYAKDPPPSPRRPKPSARHRRASTPKAAGSNWRSCAEEMEAGRDERPQQINFSQSYRAGSSKLVPRSALLPSHVGFEAQDRAEGLHEDSAKLPARRVFVPILHDTHSGLGRFRSSAVPSTGRDPPPH